jgi:hypothetical protein
MPGSDRLRHAGVAHRRLVVRRRVRLRIKDRKVVGRILGRAVDRATGIDGRVAPIRSNQVLKIVRAPPCGEVAGSCASSLSRSVVRSLRDRSTSRYCSTMTSAFAGPIRPYYQRESSSTLRVACRQSRPAPPPARARRPSPPPDTNPSLSAVEPGFSAAVAYCARQRPGHPASPLPKPGGSCGARPFSMPE